MIQAIIYDLDGTLLDSFERGFKNFFAIAKHLGFPCEGRKEIARREWNNGASSAIRACWPEADVSRFVEEWVRHDRKNPMSLVLGARGTLEWVRERGIVQAILTSRTNDGTDSQIAHNQIQDFFEIVSSCGGMEYMKPHPRSADAVLARFRELGVVDRNSMAFIGDSIVDHECAQNLGIPFFAVLSGHGTAAEFMECGVPAGRILSSVAALPAVSGFWRESKAGHRALKILSLPAGTKTDSYN